jgi:hypothetical protein
MVTILPPKTNLGSALGQQLGAGIQQGMNRQSELSQNRAEEMRQTSNLREALANAEKIYTDPNLPSEQKQLGLFKALAGHPEMAKQVVNQFNQQQQQQQQQQQIMQQQQLQMQQQQQALRALERQRNLPEGSLQGFEGNLSVAASATKPQIGPGGLTGQSVPPEISQKANEILTVNKESNADDLKMKMDEAGIPPIYSNSYVENRRRQDETKAATREKRIEAGNKRAEKVLESADKLRESIPTKEASLYAMKDAIENGDMSFFSLDNLAELTGIEGFRTAKGGQFKTASKNFFISTLSKSGARPNQFLEKQIADGLPRIGRSKEGNLIGTELAGFEIDVEKKRLELIDQISDEYEKTLGYVPGSFGKEVDKSMKQYVEERQEQLAHRLKFLNEQESKGPKLSGKFVDVIGPDGNEYEIDESELDQLPQGYKRK